MLWVFAYNGSKIMIRQDLSEEQLRSLTIDQLEQEVRHHNRLYWDEDAPEISDYDYDRLARRLKELAPDSSVLKEMGPRTRFGEEVVHSVPMLSLDKCYTDGDLETWAEKFDSDVIVTPKMDGIAACLRYGDLGRLVLAATRGDGISGDDITANAISIRDIPRKLPKKNIEVRGEIYMRRSVFAGYQEQFSNPRNLAAGAIKHKDPERCAAYELSFAAYDLLNSELSTEKSKLEELVKMGFAPVEYKQVDKTGIRYGYEYFANAREKLDFEIDGVVFKVNSVTEQQSLGSTAHHPRYAMAYKFQGDSANTVLNGVEWSVARSGAITPIAIIEPVFLSGAAVARASLHNAGQISKLGLSIGAEVMVTRRGGVIPHVECVSKPGHSPVVLPTDCPSCGEQVVQQGDFFYCPYPFKCRDVIIGTVAHFCSVVDIQGFGEKILTEAFDKGLLSTPADLYELTENDLLRLERVGKKLAAKLMEQVDEHRQMELAIFLRALGIQEMGKHVSGILQNRFRTIEKIRQVGIEELAGIHSIGETIAKNVVDGLAEKKELIDRLLDHIAIEAEKGEGVGIFAGKSFVFTGKLLSLDRKTAQKMVKEHGGETPNGISQKLNFLVVGDGKEGQKSGKQIKTEKIIAEGGEIKIISESEFLKMIGHYTKLF
ncbi:MAG: NAD-dependent DNA ligase LigA [Pseudomonadota bacterium]